jgi:hypothetical protein
MRKISVHSITALVPGDYYALSTNIYIARLLKLAGVWPGFVAKARVLVLKSPKSSEPDIGRKRLIFSSIYDWDHKAVVDLIRENKLELKDRLLAAALPARPHNKSLFDIAIAVKLFGFKEGDHQPTEDTVLAAVDNGLKLERVWTSKGFGPIDHPNK